MDAAQEWMLRHRLAQRREQQRARGQERQPRRARGCRGGRRVRRRHESVCDEPGVPQRGGEQSESALGSELDASALQSPLHTSLLETDCSDNLASAPFSADWDLLPVSTQRPTQASEIESVGARVRQRREAARSVSVCQRTVSHERQRSDSGSA